MRRDRRVSDTGEGRIGGRFCEDFEEVGGKNAGAEAANVELVELDKAGLNRARRVELLLLLLLFRAPLPPVVRVFEARGGGIEVEA